MYLSDSKLLIFLRDSHPEIELIDIFDREFDSENVIDLRLLQLINAYSEIFSTDDGIIILSNEIQFSNDLTPIYVVPSIIETDDKFVHPEKHSFGILVILVKFTKLIQFSNASLNIIKFEKGKQTDIKLKQFLKQNISIILNFREEKSSFVKNLQFLNAEL